MPQLHQLPRTPTTLRNESAIYKGPIMRPSNVSRPIVSQTDLAISLSKLYIQLSEQGRIDDALKFGFVFRAATTPQVRFKRSSSNVSQLLNNLISAQSPLVLSELSIHQYHDEFEGISLQFLPHNEFIVVGGRSKLNIFLRALESAPELRDVRIISVIALSAREDILPDLQSLLLDDLPFNVLQHVLASIAPGSHRIKDHDEYDESDGGDEPVLKLLRTSNVNTILLDGGHHDSPWVDRNELRSILRELPGLKTFIMSSWKWVTEEIHALERPKSS
ncbi:hypothetical protein B0J17DRAFT_633435 [Rhizoctonia solani]|nr:hypothetical protein B0J17DRAFT_633435 [Rhizoctonia solani]